MSQSADANRVMPLDSPDQASVGTSSSTLMGLARHPQIQRADGNIKQMRKFTNKVPSYWGRPVIRSHGTNFVESKSSQSPASR